MAGGATQDPEEMITAINVTPLVDIILVLLIIFMLTANIIMSPAIEVELPQAATGEGTDPTTLALTLTKDGALYLNGQQTDETRLAAYIPGVVATDPKTQAIIAADKEVSHGAVIHLIDLVRQKGVYKFALNIDPSVTPPSLPP
ncbi:MAG: biopolymer transporter ExbD [Deltaproteobacteria bacterium]|nr:biopolymer transporter ExbD [Deltaproteobacteria bacterium]